MTRILLRHLLVFLCGAGVTAGVLAMWRGNGRAIRSADAPDEKATAPPAESRKEIVRVESEAPPAAAPDTGADRARKLLDSTLPVLRQFDGSERTARVLLLLTQLKREGAAGIRALADFLATGEDLPLGPIAVIGSMTMSSRGSLRMQIINHLALMREPEARALYAGESLRTLKTVEGMEDALGCIRALESTNPGRYRAEAIAAAQRLMSEPETPANNILGGVMQIAFQYGAKELLPFLETRALEKTAGGLNAYLGALWKFPAQEREQRTTQFLSNEAVADAVQENLPIHNLDYTIPAAREAAHKWFASSRGVLAKADGLKNLMSESWGPSMTLNYSRPKPDPAFATPGTATQAQARLTFLDEISSCCPEPLFQQTLATVRESLKSQLTGKK